MKLSEERQRLVKMLKDSLSLMCKTALSYKAQLSIEGLLGITLDDEDVFLVNINQCFKSEDPNTVANLFMVTAQDSPKLLDTGTESPGEDPGEDPSEIPFITRKRGPPIESVSIYEEEEADIPFVIPKKKRGRPKKPVSPKKSTPKPKICQDSAGKMDLKKLAAVRVGKGKATKAVKKEPYFGFEDSDDDDDDNDVAVPDDMSEASEADPVAKATPKAITNPDLKNLAAARGGKQRQKQIKQEQPQVVTISLPEHAAGAYSHGTISYEGESLSYETKPIMEEEQEEQEEQFSEMVSVPSVTEQHVQVDEHGNPTVVMVVEQREDGSQVCHQLGEQVELQLQAVPQPETPAMPEPTRPLTQLQLGDGTGPMSCQKCQARFKYIQTLRRHSKVCPAKTNPVLQIASPVTVPQSSAVLHSTVDLCTVQSVVTISPEEFSCKICGQTFDNVAVYNGHMNAHYDTRPFTCQHCGVTFNYNSAFAHHIKICSKRPTVVYEAAVDDDDDANL